MNFEKEMIVLDKNWLIDTDKEFIGRENGYPLKPTESAKGISVPGLIQQAFPYYSGCAWFWRYFDDELKRSKTDRLFLRFECVDYRGYFYVNGHYLGVFESGETQVEFDVTDFVKPEGNLIAVCIINPGIEEIDGLTMIKIPKRNKSAAPRSGSGINSGGLPGFVKLFVRRGVSITDIFPIADIHTGEVKLEITVENYTGEETKADLKISVRGRSGIGEKVAGLAESYTVLPGKNVFKTSVVIDNPVLWDMDNPHLYAYYASLESKFGEGDYFFKFGFRELKTVGGYFYLNGKKIFLKSAHSGNEFPVGLVFPVFDDQWTKDFLNAKEAGFNTIRNIAHKFMPQQLDFCDEIGLMVLGDCYASWLLGVGEPAVPEDEVPAMLARYDDCMSKTILQDRNHTCLVAWELLNETFNTPVYKNAVAFMPKLRALDPSRMVITSSGRFDADHSVGNACNPYENELQQVWGSTEHKLPEGLWEVGPTEWGMGDVHKYPTFPQHDAVFEHFFALGKDSLPIFISEYGIGTTQHVIHEARCFEQNGCDPALSDYLFMKKQEDKLEADFDRMGWSKAFVSPEAMLTESQRLGARQRTLEFDIIRCNPNVCGFSLTGLLDHGICGEGLWTRWRRWKPGMHDAIIDGFSPLRFCMFVYPMNAYAGKPFRIKVDFANESALKPGSYKTFVRIVSSDNEIVWSRDLDTVIPEDMPLAVPLIDEYITLNVPTGKYTMYADIEGCSPTGHSLDFYITDENDFGTVDAKIAVWGVDENGRNFLARHGVTVTELSENEDLPVIVGYPGDFDCQEKWDLLRAKAEKGLTVGFLASELFREHRELCGKITDKKFVIRDLYDWLYHKEVIALPNGVFEGLKKGMFDADYVGNAFPLDVIETDLECEVLASCYETGFYASDDGYFSAYNAIRFGVGKGSYLFNTMNVLYKALGNPVSGRLLVNYVKEIIK